MKRGPQDKTKVSERADLMADWDEGKNSALGLSPDRIVIGSTVRAWWKCHVCGLEWESVVRDRTKAKCGCPACARKVRGASRVKTTIAQRGSFSDERLLLDWNYEKNAPAQPSDFTRVSNFKVWWKCHECGYEWQAKISNRVHGRGCPACSGKVLYVGHNDLATQEPDLAKEWHPTMNGDLRPCDVMRGQARKVWWLCPQGHSYQASLNKRSSDHTGCPICNSGRQTSFREQAFFYYIKQIFSDAVSRYQAPWLGRFELDIFIPSRILAIEYDGVAWHHQEKFERERRKFSLCRERGIRLIRIKEQMPEETVGHDLADEILSVEDIERGENFQNLVQLVLDRIDPRSNMWTRRDPRLVHSPIHVDLDRDRFMIRSVFGVIKGSFGERYPELAREWHPTLNDEQTPFMFKPGSSFKAWWICPKCGREYEATISHRVGGTGCANCCREKFAASYRENHLAKVGGITDAKLLAEWNYIRNGDKGPSAYSPGCADMVWWMCRKCGYEWQAKISNRSHGRGCPCCANRIVVKGKNDLATLYPEIAAEWDHERNGTLRPDQIVPGRNGKVWWVCSKCGHHYQAPPSRRTSQGSGCRKCADKANGLQHRKHCCDVAGQLLFDFGLE